MEHMRKLDLVRRIFGAYLRCLRAFEMAHSGKRTTLMAVYDQTRPTMDGRTVQDRVNRLIPRLLGRAAAWNDARATRNALSRLSDRELDDIGICRGDIRHIAETAPTGRRR